MTNCCWWVLLFWQLVGSTIGRASASSSTQLQLFTILSLLGAFFVCFSQRYNAFFSPVGVDINATFAENCWHQAFKKKLKSHLVSLLKRLFLIHLDRCIIWNCSSALIRDFRCETSTTVAVMFLQSWVSKALILSSDFPSVLEVGLTFPSSSSSSCPNTFANIWELT